MGVSDGAGRGVPDGAGELDDSAATRADRTVAVALMPRSSSWIEVVGTDVAAGRAVTTVPGSAP